MIKVAITGGICSGKSTICRLVERLGFSVYYCDERGSYLIDNDPVIREDIIAIFGEQAYRDGRLNRPYISERAFSSKELLERLNAATHPRVIEDFEQWVATCESGGASVVFIESAILFESGLDGVVDRIIAVNAPTELRVARALVRDGLSEPQVRARIAAQMSDSERSSRSHYTILCDDQRLVIPQLLSTIDAINHSL